MKTYQDLLKAGEGEKARGEFCKAAINDFMSTQAYKDAQAGEAYYNKHNLTIEQFQKFIYTLSGRKIQDTFSVNYKLKTLFFRRLVLQQVQYVLGNGVVLQEENNKEKLGKDFDKQITKAAKRAMASGTAFGFWNLDHLEVFGYANTEKEPGFCPLYDEETAQLMAGIRFWFRTVGNQTNFRATLYEPDGYTEYVQYGSDNIQEMQAKKAYKVKIKKAAATGIESVTDENYGVLPIVPLYANDSHESELVGIRECLDCYDYIKSGLANNIDDADGFFWILQNTGAMDDVDLANFVQRIKTVRAAMIDTDAGQSAEAHTLEIPVEARRTMLEILEKDIYKDFQALNVETLSAAAKTTQEIQAAYQSQDNKCADFEYYVIDFIQKILELAGINDNPTFIWNKVVNMQEQTQTVLMAANYLDEETIIKHLPFLTPEEADKVIARRSEVQLEQFDDVDEEETEEEETEGLNEENEAE